MNFHRKPITYVEHVRIKVSNLARSLAYYQAIIGFSVLEQTDRTAVLTVDGKTSILSLEQVDNAEPKRRTTGLYHFAILLPHRSDLAQIVYHFAENGVRLGSADHLVSEALYLNDPDGNGIEIYADRDPSVWKWGAGEVAMTTDPLDFADLVASVQKQSWSGLPKGTVMGHIHLHVSELVKTEQFYVEGLGFDVVNRYGGQALFISSGKYHHHIGLNTWNGVGAPAPAANSVGLDWFSLMYDNEEARQAVITNLERIGATVTREGDHYVTADPSGNRILLKI